MLYSGQFIMVEETGQGPGETAIHPTAASWQKFSGTVEEETSMSWT